MTSYTVNLEDLLEVRFQQLKTFGVSPNADFVLRIFDIGYLDVYFPYLQILAADVQ